MPDAWYVETPAGPVGPLSLDQLRGLARRGRLAPAHRVSLDQLTWQLAGEVPGLVFPQAVETLHGDPREFEPADGGTVVTSERSSDDGIGPGDRFAGYEILDLLGRGAMGVVFSARQTALGRTVALKTIRVYHRGDERAAVRFAREVEAVARLRHPNIVTAYDSGRHEGHYYFTMELLHGETLYARLERAPRRLAEPLAWQIVRQAAAGLAHAAAEGVVHRDVKPANLFLTPSPTGYPLPPGVPMVKVTDFGLALLKGPVETDVRLTAVNAVMGTPPYMAPEQFAGSDVDSRADIYALGATAFEMLVGRTAFPGKNLLELARVKSSGELPAAPDLSPGSRALLKAMMAADPARRLADYGELLTRIDALLATEPAAAPKRRVPRWLTRAAGMAFVLLAGWLLWPRAGVGPPPAEVVSGYRLFDGVSIARWNVVRGAWQPTADAEGGRVLAGDGLIRRALPDVERLRLTLALDLHAATAVELQVAVAADGSRLALRVERDGVQFGRRADDAAPFVALAPVRARPAAADDRSPYVELKAERYGRRWWLGYEGHWLGSAEAADARPEFFVAVEGGTAHFESVEVLELR